MKKAMESDRDFQYALLEFRNAPIAGMSYSPAQLLQSRHLKDKLPTPATALQPKLVEEAPSMLYSRQQKQKQYYDRTARPLPDIKVGDTVQLREGKEWTPAVIADKHPAPRSFQVTTEDGREYRRNRRFLRHTLEPPPVISCPIDDAPIATPARSTHTKPNVAPAAEPAPSRSSTRVKSTPVWHKDYVVSK